MSLRVKNTVSRSDRDLTIAPSLSSILDNLLSPLLDHQDEVRALILIESVLHFSDLLVDLTWIFGHEGLDRFVV